MQRLCRIFLQTAEELGFPILNGMSMLLLQGREACRLFTGHTPDVDIMRRVVKQELTSQNREADKEK